MAINPLKPLNPTTYIQTLVDRAERLSDGETTPEAMIIAIIENVRSQNSTHAFAPYIASMVDHLAQIHLGVSLRLTYPSSTPSKEMTKARIHQAFEKSIIPQYRAILIFLNKTYSATFSILQYHFTAVGRPNAIIEREVRFEIFKYLPTDSLHVLATSSKRSYSNVQAFLHTPDAIAKRKFLSCPVCAQDSSLFLQQVSLEKSFYASLLAYMEAQKKPVLGGPGSAFSKINKK